MFFPNRGPSSEEMQKALFDYLNLNRHKFDEYGNFHATPDSRDVLPRLLTVSDHYKPPKLTPEKPWLNRDQRNRAKYPEANQLRDPKTDEDFVRERYEERIEHAKRRRKYSKDQCEKHYEAALKRCNDMYWSNALYPDGSFDGCKQRAGELWQDCHNKGKYPKGKMEWANRDMDIVDESEISKPPTISLERELQPVTELLSEPEPDPGSARSDLYGWAKSQLERFSPSLLEGSEEAQTIDGQRLTFQVPWRRVLRGSRVTPGMGLGGGIGGGGKALLFPRIPGDPRVFQRIY